MFFAFNLLLILAAVVLILLVAATASAPVHHQAGRLLVNTPDAESDTVPAQVTAAGMQ